VAGKRPWAGDRSTALLSLPADFLIFPDGSVLTDRHGRDAYDQWSVGDLATVSELIPSGAASTPANIKQTREPPRRPRRGTHSSGLEEPSAPFSNRGLSARTLDGSVDFVTTCETGSAMATRRSA
jgi:hypothetical protein